MISLKNQQHWAEVWNSVWSCLLSFPCPSLPQNALLPAGFRQKDQTTKAATGPFDRERLLSYLEKQALEHKDREDFVPFTGEKKGTVHARVGTGWQTAGMPCCLALLWDMLGHKEWGSGLWSRAAGAEGQGGLSAAVCLSLLWSPRGSSMACGGTGTQEHQSSKAPWSLEVPSPTPQGLFLLSIRPMQGYCSGGGVQEETHKCLFEWILPTTAVSNSTGNTVMKNKYFSTCLLAHLAMLFMQTLSLLPLSYSYRKKRGKQENLILII